MPQIDAPTEFLPDQRDTQKLPRVKDEPSQPAASQQVVVEVPPHSPSNVMRMLVVVVMALGMHALMAGLIPNALGSGLFQAATIAVGLTVIFGTLAVLLDAPEVTSSRFMLFMASTFCVVAVIQDTAAFAIPILKAKGWL